MKKTTEEQFVESMNGRKAELATALLAENPDTEALKANNFAPMIIVEMAHRIRREVEGRENFIVKVSTDEIAETEPNGQKTVEEQKTPIPSNGERSTDEEPATPETDAAAAPIPEAEVAETETAEVVDEAGTEEEVATPMTPEARADARTEDAEITDPDSEQPVAGGNQMTNEPLKSSCCEG